MNDKISEGFSVETYITMQENLLIEHIRRSLQAETKVAILESGLRELYKKNEELTAQIDVQKNTIDQSINGLQTTTNERDRLNNEREKLQSKIRELEASLNDINDEKNKYKNQVNNVNNRATNLEYEIDQLNNRVQIANNDYATLKDNYNKVLSALEEANAKVERFESLSSRKEKKLSKKIANKDSEWVDGEYKVST